MPNGTQRISELLSAPMEAAIVALGVGIARAQRELDRHSIEMQREINEDPELSELGLQATWYQMPRTELELTMAITMEEQAPAPAAPPGPALPRATAAAAILAPYRLRQIHLAPVNALYKNQFDFDVQASSKLKLAIVPVPPPTGEGVVTPRLSREEVLQIARPRLSTEANTRLAVNFNGQARLWFVLQYRLEDDRLNRRALVVIDDDTRQIVKHVAGS